MQKLYTHKPLLGNSFTICYTKQENKLAIGNRGLNPGKIFIWHLDPEVQQSIKMR